MYTWAVYTYSVP